MLCHQPYLIHAMKIHCMPSHLSPQINIVSPQPRSGGNSSDRNPLVGSERIIHVTTRHDRILVYLLACEKALAASRDYLRIILENFATISPFTQLSALSRNLRKVPTICYKCECSCHRPRGRYFRDHRYENLRENCTHGIVVTTRREILFCYQSSPSGMTHFGPWLSV
jgi:hypothetical protein